MRDLLNARTLTCGLELTIPFGGRGGVGRLRSIVEQRRHQRTPLTPACAAKMQTSRRFVTATRRC